MFPCQINQPFLMKALKMLWKISNNDMNIFYRKKKIFIVCPNKNSIKDPAYERYLLNTLFDLAYENGIMLEPELLSWKNLS